MDTQRVFYPKLLGLGRHFGLKCFEAFGVFLTKLKVSQFQNELKYEVIISPSLHRAEILTIFRLYLERNDDFINTF